MMRGDADSQKPVGLGYSSLISVIRNSRTA